MLTPSSGNHFYTLLLLAAELEQLPAEVKTNKYTDIMNAAKAEIEKIENLSKRDIRMDITVLHHNSISKIKNIVAKSGLAGETLLSHINNITRNETDSLEPIIMQQKEKIPESERENSPVKESDKDLSIMHSRAQEIPPPSRQDLENISGHIWSCFDCKENPSGKGYLYLFKPRPEFLNNSSEDNEKAYIEKNMEIFPATEAPTEWIKLNSYLKINDPPEVQQFFADLGYKLNQTQDGVELQIPDREALIDNYQRICSPNQLKVATTPQQAGDMEFIKAYLSNDVLISSGIPFFHDQVDHGITTIKAIKSYPDLYRTTKDNHIKILTKAIQRIESTLQELNDLEKNSNKEPIFWDVTKLKEIRYDIEKLVFMLAVVVDNESARDRPHYNAFVDTDMERLPLYIRERFSQAFSLAMFNRFGENVQLDSFDSLNKLWKKMGERFDEIRYLELRITNQVYDE